MTDIIFRFCSKLYKNILCGFVFIAAEEYVIKLLVFIRGLAQQVTRQVTFKEICVEVKGSGWYVLECTKS